MLPRADACGTSWGSYVLADSGAADCSGCGEAITSYDDCATAAASGAAALGIGGLGGAETWGGPPGCHIQDGSHFQYNTNMDGGSAGGHTPVCLASDAAACDDSMCTSPDGQGGYDCCASMDWGEPQTCAAGYVAEPTGDYCMYSCCPATARLLVESAPPPHRRPRPPAPKANTAHVLRGRLWWLQGPRPLLRNPECRS